MRKKIIFLPIVFFHLFMNQWMVWGQYAPVTVFESGAMGYKNFRIPAIIQLPDHTILAFCEGRVNGLNDFGDINIVMKTSRDGGKTWSGIQTVVDADRLQAGNPAPVVDLTDPRYPRGRIFLFYNTGNNHEGEIRKGKGLREVWYKTSLNNGETWSEPVNITLQTHRPSQPSLNPAYLFKDDWRSYANTPGHAMQFSKGKYRGRIFVAANHSAGEPQKNFTDYTAHGFFTDDHGKSFRLSESVNFPGSNESTAAEIGNNRLMMNSRNQQGDRRFRIISISSDGGKSWEKSFFDSSLSDPVCEGSLLFLGYKKNKAILAFSNNDDQQQRNKLTLRISFNNGFNWQKSIGIDKADTNVQKDYTGYSDIVKLDGQHIGILYEKDNYARIVFAVTKWDSHE
ncbi:MAG: hypothetical protein RLZZ28_931 [Bacteroidota bacterium]